MFNTQDYINSGILELYVMGALPQEESAEVERRAATDTVVAQEIREIRSALGELDRHHHRTPRAGVRNAVLDLIASDSANASLSAASSDARAVSRREEFASIDAADARADADHVRTHGTSTANIVELPERRRTGSRYSIAASWILIALSVGSAAYFGTQWRSAENEVAALKRESDSLKTEMSVIAGRADQRQRALAVVQDPNSKVVTMAGTAHAPGTHAVVFWNPRSRQVHLAGNDLPMPPSGKQYQLWAIKGDQRVDAGVFDINGSTDSPQRLNDIENADAFAVTLERAGGSPTPDLESIIAVGKL